MGQRMSGANQMAIPSSSGNWGKYIFLGEFKKEIRIFKITNKILSNTLADIYFFNLVIFSVIYIFDPLMFIIYFHAHFNIMKNKSYYSYYVFTYSRYLLLL